MTDSYESVRAELEELQYEFERRCSKSTSLQHQELVYGSCEALSEATWNAFIDRYTYLPDETWHKWHIYPDRTRCGRFFGMGSSMPEFVTLAETVMSVLVRLRAIPKCGEAFLVDLPSFSGFEAWLRLIYDTGELCGSPALTRSWWNASVGKRPSLPLGNCWSRVDANGVQIPLYPESFLAGDIFKASAEVLTLFLQPPLPLGEFQFLLGFRPDFVIPAFLPEVLSEEAIAEGSDDTTVSSATPH